MSQSEHEQKFAAAVQHAAYDDYESDCKLASGTAGRKRSYSMTGAEEPSQEKPLRDKNRTNSKRFRDRRKNYMDGLFEDKYHLGKDNNDLRESNEKLRAMLEEAMAENELQRRTQAYVLNPLIPALLPDPVFQGLDSSRYLCMAGAADQILAGLKGTVAAATSMPALRATRIEEYVTLRRPELGPSVPEPPWRDPSSER
jgi:hypothetical protein